MRALVSIAFHISHPRVLFSPSQPPFVSVFPRFAVVNNFTFRVAGFLFLRLEVAFRPCIFRGATGFCGELVLVVGLRAAILVAIK